jgi:FkbM family methyltransferase
VGYGEKINRNLRDIAQARGNKDGRAKVARRYVHDALRRVVPYTGVERQGLMMFSATADRTIGRALFVDGWWDWDGLPRALQHAGIDLNGRTMVDVGANIGTTTIQAASMGARVIAFEPDPLNFRLLRANVAVNGLDDSVTCIEAACSTATGDGWLARSQVNAGDHRVASTGEVPIRLVRLDTALADARAAQVDLLWMDTQGHEAQVLAGASRLLVQHPVIVTEFWPSVLGARLTDFAELLAEYKTVVDLATGVPTTIDSAAARYANGSTDLLLI